MSQITILYKCAKLTLTCRNRGLLHPLDTPHNPQAHHLIVCRLSAVSTAQTSLQRLPFTTNRSPLKHSPGILESDFILNVSLTH